MRVQAGLGRQELELWVGPEASYVRAGDLVSDELELTGFGNRAGDLRRLASLGARRMRFPLLWERTWPEGCRLPDWHWADRALPESRALGLDPVVGLVHHGGGVVPGGLLDAGFAEGLAAYASAVARRFPWVNAYTPVNEPLTTARFSALYGFWHPHAQGDASFVRALLNELRGTVLSMRAIREVNPLAALVQTEDMGRVYGMPAVQEQVDFENLRRWLSLDLLCGRVDEGHGLWDYLLWAGATQREVLWFAGHPCPPQVIGLNVYPTSERFLDDRLERYPAHLYGGNGRQVYADLEAVRVRGELPGSFYERLTEAHARYGLPLAVTEAHLGCTREEQLRWLSSAWQDALRARQDGAEVLAVTAWAAFGSCDWDSLLTRRRGRTEPGLWDIRFEPPRETALAGLARDLAAGRTPEHPALAGPGWWQRAERAEYPPDTPLVARSLSGPAVCVGPGPLQGLLLDLCHRRGFQTVTHQSAAEDSVWAVLEASDRGTLHLAWLGRGRLTVRAPALEQLQLQAALDLLLDGETGVWLWDGQLFAPTEVALVAAGRPSGARRSPAERLR